MHQMVKFKTKLIQSYNNKKKQENHFVHLSISPNI